MPDETVAADTTTDAGPPPTTSVPAGEVFDVAAVRGSVAHEGESVVLRLVGELDAAAFDELDRRIRELDAEQPSAFVLDLRGLSFMDSSGIRLLVQERQRCGARGGRLIVVRGPAFLDRLLELVGLDDVLELVDEPPGA